MSENQIKHHKIYFETELVKLLKTRYSVKTIFADLYEISKGKRTIFYDVDAALIFYSKSTKGYPCGVDGLFNKILTQLK